MGFAKPACQKNDWRWEGSALWSASESWPLVERHPQWVTKWEKLERPTCRSGCFCRHNLTGFQTFAIGDAECGLVLQAHLLGESTRGNGLG